MSSAERYSHNFSYGDNGGRVPADWPQIEHCKDAEKPYHRGSHNHAHPHCCQYAHDYVWMPRLGYHLGSNMREKCRGSFEAYGCRMASVWGRTGYHALADELRQNEVGSVAKEKKRRLKMEEDGTLEMRDEWPKWGMRRAPMWGVYGEASSYGILDGVVDADLDVGDGGEEIVEGLNVVEEVNEEPAMVLRYQPPAPTIPRSELVRIPLSSDDAHAIQALTTVTNFSPRASLTRSPNPRVENQDPKPKACLTKLPTELIHAIFEYLPPNDAISLGLSTLSLSYMVPTKAYQTITILYDQDILIHGTYASDLATLWTAKREGITWYDFFSGVRYYCWVEVVEEAFVVFLHSVEVVEGYGSLCLERYRGTWS